MAWLDELETKLRTNWTPGQQFKLEDVYECCEEELQRLHPENRHVQEKIRQLLQELRNGGRLEFVDEAGTYRLQPPSRVGGHFPIPASPRDDLVRAMRTFDSDLRSSRDWGGWEDNNSHKFAILFEIGRAHV